MNFQQETAMEIQGIDHAEFCVGDAIALTQSLCSVYGFRAYGRGGPETGLPGQRSVLLGQGDVRILLTSGLHEDHPASQLVARHGDGVAVIGLRTDVAAGAAGDLLTLIDHVALCVPSGQLDPVIAFHEQVLGFTVIFREYVGVGAQGMISKAVQSPSGGATFTVIEPDLSRRPGQIDDFLAWHGGAGGQHLAFLTQDIVHAVRALSERGAGFAATPSSYYDMLGGRPGPTEITVEALRPLGILADRDHWGQMYQVFAKSTRIRRTYFHELIERRGARTFGMSNIPALYAAKDRELAEIREMTGTTHA
jgi:4-hydroxymandelate synthase